MVAICEVSRFDLETFSRPGEWRDSINPAEVLRFARRELFAPLGMHHVTLQLDGFWTDRGESFGATYRIEYGMPPEAFFAKGSIDQYVIIVPSERLIVVHFGRSPNLPPDADGVYQLVQDVIAATSHSGRPAAGN
jgi:CubicO group peptidase (beta-lactamase class C family)